MTLPSRVLILGATGQVGIELQRSFSGAGEIIAYDRRQADLSQPQQLRRVIQTLRPAIILNAAAYTAVDRAESEPEIAMTVNGEAPGILAEEAAKLDALLVHYSTDYVFDGRKTDPWIEDDEPAPLNIYGKSKLAGELAIQKAGGKYLIFRTSWVYGPHGRNFMLTMLRLGQERGQLRVVSDQFGAPTSSIAIANATYTAVERTVFSDVDVSGIYHMTCGGQTTWADFARSIFEVQESRRPEVISITTEEYPTPAARPRNSVLSNEKLHGVFGLKLPDWETALNDVRKRLILQ